MAIQPPDPLLARLVAKLPKGKRSKKIIAMLPILAEIVRLTKDELDLANNRGGL